MDEKQSGRAGEQAETPEDGRQQAGEAVAAEEEAVAGEEAALAAAPMPEAQGGEEADKTGRPPLKPVELVFTYTKQEYLRAARHYLLASKTITLRNVVLVGVLVVFALAYGIWGGFNTGSVVLLVLGGVVLLLGCTLYFYIPARSYSKTGKYHEEYRLAFTGEGIHFTTPSIDSQIGWATYTDAWESREVFYLITGPQAYTVVPKRAFAGEEQMADFRALLAARVAPIKPV